MIDTARTEYREYIWNEVVEDGLMQAKEMVLRKHQDKNIQQGIFCDHALDGKCLS